MTKFRYHYLTNELAYQPLNSKVWYPIEETFIGSFGSLGFKVQGWMNFTFSANKMRVFYKQTQETDWSSWKPRKATYFRKDLPKQALVIFEFESQDEVWKQGGRWVKRGELWK